MPRSPCVGCCPPFGRRPPWGDKYAEDGSSSDAAAPSCPFCAISRGAKQHRVVFQSERLMVFHSIRPQARVHLLVVPRHHIANTDNLGPGDADLAEEMERVGGDVLRRLAAPLSGSGGGGGYKFGYHVPPWRSVDHLHLHCMALPHSPPWAALKYALPGVWLSSGDLIAQLCHHWARLRRLRGGSGGGGGGPVAARRAAGRPSSKGDTATALAAEDAASLLVDTDGGPESTDGPGRAACMTEGGAGWDGAELESLHGGGRAHRGFTYGDTAALG